MDIIRSEPFGRWLRRLKDRRAKARILMRLDRLALGNPGDVRPIGSGLSELRVDVGPGYRIYFMQKGQALIVLLCGGDKRSQKRDILRAHLIAREWEQLHNA
ncbi:type II toxin-antitoxin system RelE/ParE family toxin [Methylonatrum kenyense]|uniref:type II toxin-antitoxin system RelE/ParE family toxin n=1 Tax=Methylonatrum kenyense TaxID=455253 RepID=UPI0020BEBD65|nr:type II toxin-antitoxin system RelE/ParE family toxin [Methylonatrum kenyense]MCK8514990.1 type II toxin-antitoxin system RelE/ParE family toxin [Methylonatrum kenyense]